MFILPSDRKNNRWADEALWNVLQAQDRRNVAALCDALDHADAEVRRTAALAFASVQDTAGIPCLTRSLDDPEPRVRAAAVFAMGLVADTALVVDLAERAVLEPPTPAYSAPTCRPPSGRWSATACCATRTPSSTTWTGTPGTNGCGRRMPLRRLSADTLRNMQATYVDLVRRETDPRCRPCWCGGCAAWRVRKWTIVRQYLQQEGSASGRYGSRGVRGGLPELLRTCRVLQDDDATLRPFGAVSCLRHELDMQRNGSLHLKACPTRPVQGGFRCVPDLFLPSRGVSVWSLEMTNAHDSTLVLTLHRYDSLLSLGFGTLSAVQEGVRSFPPWSSVRPACVGGDGRTTIERCSKAHSGSGQTRTPDWSASYAKRWPMLASGFREVDSKESPNNWTCQGTIMAIGRARVMDLREARVLTTVKPPSTTPSTRPAARLGERPASTGS